MNVAQRLKIPSDPWCNLMVRKNDERTKQRQFFFSFDIKFICYHSFPVVIDKRETKYENKSTVFDRQKEINR